MDHLEKPLELAMISHRRISPKAAKLAKFGENES